MDDLGFAEVLFINDTTEIVPEGYLNIALLNFGTSDATITQNGNSWVLPTGREFNFGARKNNKGWMAVTVNAVGTQVQCVFLK